MGLIREAITAGRWMNAYNNDDQEAIEGLKQEALRRIEYERRQDEAIDQIWEGIKNFFMA